MSGGAAPVHAGVECAKSATVEELTRPPTSSSDDTRGASGGVAAPATGTRAERGLRPTGDAPGAAIGRGEARQPT